MTSKIVVGPFNRGLRNDVTPFNVDKDSFPVIQNAYQWRGRVKRKRGTSPLGNLQRFIGTADGSGDATITIFPNPLTEDAQGTGIFILTSGMTTQILTDPGGASPVTLLNTGTGSATLNYTTGVLSITGALANATIIYFPGLPVMGIEELALQSTQFPGTLAFDTTYSYNILPSEPYSIYDVSFYKNPPTGTYTDYVQKASPTPLWWNGQDYQQFYTVNYQGALWASNGINIPFSPTNIGMQFKLITGVEIEEAGNGTTVPAVATLTIDAHGLVVGDFVFINEVQGITGINFQTGYVTTVVDANNVDVTFLTAVLGGAYTSSGIAQYLTNTAITTKDCLRWYDGDPTNAVAPFSTLTGRLGWVNFAPPISQAVFSIADLPQRQYYLVGARTIVPFKDRLLFFGAVVQASTGNAIYLQDTVVYSQNGTPFYTCTFMGDPTLPTTTFTSILVPINQTGTAGAYFADSTGFGGNITAGVSQPIVTTAPNEDVLITGFSQSQTRFVYTGSDIIPFNFFRVNSEYGSASTFSTITLDKGVLTRGTKGFTITSQTGTERIDNDIPDEVFEIGLTNNGNERFTAIRDFVNEWLYFTYPVDNTEINGSVEYEFPNKTLFYNYRDNSWSSFLETYTTYGYFRKLTGFTWATLPYTSWRSWQSPWNSGDTSLLNPIIIAGNQQGYIVVRDDSITTEAPSLNIQNMVANLVTSPNHGLNNNDYVTVTGVQGTLGTLVNNKIFQISGVTGTTFLLNNSALTGSYLGGGQIARMYIPFIQTKQFPTAWEIGRKTRIGTQQYLLSTTNDSQIQLLIYLSQNAAFAYNEGNIVPESGVDNSGLIYSTVLYTCPESANLGLTPANTNLQMISEINSAGTNASSPQAQIWHRINTSLIGDTVQLAFTLSDEQMTTVNDDGTPISQFAEIELHGFILNVSPSQLLA